MLSRRESSWRLRYPLRLRSGAECQVIRGDAAGPVAVEVLNPGGQKVFLEDGFTYK